MTQESNSKSFVSRGISLASILYKEAKSFIFTTALITCSLYPTRTTNTTLPNLITQEQARIEERIQEEELIASLIQEQAKHNPYSTIESILNNGLDLQLETLRRANELASAAASTGLRKGLARLSRYSEFINQASDSFGINPSLLTALIYVESKGNPYAVSKKGAKGLTQLMPLTAKSLGLKPWQTTHPEYSIKGGSTHLSRLLTKYHSPAFALAAYNLGEKRLDSTLRKLRKKGVPKPSWRQLKQGLPTQTIKYVPEVLGTAYAISHGYKPKASRNHMLYHNNL
ncbi:MAG TPA: transglycosylase SLT domain-containing protein [Candidatus Nanoarchaeia archaeon]|nr:transglycosylase SLT domain-containing protein [Candidatus Nanoarchaeia archaeon]